MRIFETLEIKMEETLGLMEESRMFEGLGSKIETSFNQSSC